eukprot:CAMPEP_0176010442 /NCGR_PEP_ID=MMETSP0120_2-20121206/4770_1 /TAXON_ID=160619 /ORGANISM="Kryptoperidinium foliaceum, Strain CCMP 1326" /LENGTH=302 /DNA_ID=CAMNT_0017343273 /DNA_START=25 /DNA_END=930 /DNA_ORIENTATION=+
MARKKQAAAKVKRAGAAASGGGASDGKKSKSPPKAKKPNVAKHRSKGQTSLFGPIAQPNRTWKLTDSMGGGKNNSTKRSRSKRNKRSTSSVSNNSNNSKPSGRKPFYLNMPVVSSNDPIVPWLNHAPKLKMNGNQYRKVHASLSLPSFSLDKLNLELKAFAEYVKLNEAEISSRLSVVQVIQSKCRLLFGISPESCKVFGSFACLPVCTFASDIDLAIHGIITPPTPPPSEAASQESEDDQAEDKIAWRASKRLRLKATDPHPNQKRQARVLEWKALFDEAEQKRQEEVKAAEEAKKKAEAA